MQGVARRAGRALSGTVLQHVRVGGSAVGVIQTRKESSQPEKRESLEEHGFESTTIADILKEKGSKADWSWLWCSVDDTVFDAVKSMTAHNVGALLVVKSGEGKKLAGIITERDYLRKIIVQGRSSKTTKVGDIMTEENKLITVKPDTKVLHAMELMTGNSDSNSTMASVAIFIKNSSPELWERIFNRLSDFLSAPNLTSSQEMFDHHNIVSRTVQAYTIFHKGGPLTFFQFQSQQPRLLDLIFLVGGANLSGSSWLAFGIAFGILDGRSGVKEEISGL